VCEDVIRRIVGLLQGGRPPSDGERRAQAAAAALMVECARIDQDFSDVERSAIASAAKEIFDLEDDVAQMLVEVGEKRADEVWHNWLFTEAINRGFSEEEKRALVAQLAEVANADGTLRRHEAEFIARVARELGVDESSEGPGEGSGDAGGAA